MSEPFGAHLGKLTWPQFIYAKLLLAVLYPVVWGSCSLQKPPQQQELGDLGYFQFRAPDVHMKGVVIGAPHGSGEPATGEYAKSISDQTGAGLIVAHRFSAKGLAVTRPLVGVVANSKIPNDPRSRGNIYREFGKLLRQTAGDSVVGFYVGVRSALLGEVGPMLSKPQ